MFCVLLLLQPSLLLALSVVIEWVFVQHSSRQGLHLCRPFAEYEHAANARTKISFDYDRSFPSVSVSIVGWFVTQKECVKGCRDCTFFTSKEILHIFSRYQALAPDTVPYDMSGKEAQTVQIPHHVIANMPELKENPFKEQICNVFSESGSGHMTFEEFLDMFSVFSEAAPRDIKAVYAFKLYDWDADGQLNKSDLRTTLLKLTQDGLSEDEVNFVVDKVLDEADLDDDGMLSYIEFEHVISRAPDFLNTFHVRV